MSKKYENSVGENNYYEYCHRHGTYLRSSFDVKSKQWVCLASTCPICAEEGRRKELLGKGGISQRHSQCSFKNFEVLNADQQAALTQCEQFAASFSSRRNKGQTLILHGPPGTGKNHLATAICVEVKKAGFSAAIITASDLLSRIRDTWGAAVEYSPSETQIIQKFGEIDLLVIDEVGRQSGSQNEKNIFFRVINARYEAVVPTIILSNYSCEEIAQWIGQATYDRLREGGGQAIEFAWKSQRGDVTIPYN